MMASPASPAAQLQKMQMGMRLDVGASSEDACQQPSHPDHPIQRSAEAWQAYKASITSLSGFRVETLNPELRLPLSAHLPTQDSRHRV